MSELFPIFGSPIYIATQEIQKRRHRKKRINKKWRKIYGCYEINRMPHGQVVMMDNGVIWMTKQTYEQIFKVKLRNSQRSQGFSQRFSQGKMSLTF